VQTQVLTLIIGTLHSLTCFSQENYDTLTTKAALKSAKLLKRPDQARSVCLCAHLFWSAEYRDGKRVLECLQKSLKLADGALDNAEKVQLFVEILNSYIWFFLKGNEAVNPKYLGSLRDLINTTMSAMDANAPNHAAINQYFQNTLQYGEAKSVPL
jgi:vacuolar protein sorting-associated protein 35